MLRRTSLIICSAFALVVMAVAVHSSRSQAQNNQQAPGVGARTAKAADPNPVDPTIINELVGTWKNELNSELTIRAVDKTTGAVSGSYRTVAQNGTSGDDYPLSGWVNHAPANNQNHVVVISFSVRWGQIGSVTTWNGYYATVNNSPTIVGQWLLSRSNSSFEWDHILTGQDRFHRIVTAPKN
jgi:hypothetical protein